MVDRYVKAFEDADVHGIVRLLTEDAGGRNAAISHPVHR
jgi:hypothetical protein